MIDHVNQMHFQQAFNSIGAGMPLSALTVRGKHPDPSKEDIASGHINCVDYAVSIIGPLLRNLSSNGEKHSSLTLRSGR